MLLCPQGHVHSAVNWHIWSCLVATSTPVACASAMLWQSPLQPDPVFLANVMACLQSCLTAALTAAAVRRCASWRSVMPMCQQRPASHKIALALAVIGS